MSEQPRRWIARGVLLVAALTAASCVSCPPPFQRINVRSDPTGADIFLDGDLVRQTPARLEMSTLTDHKVYLKKEGYRPELVVVEKRTGADGLVFLSPPDIFVKLVPLAREGGGLDRPGTTEGGAERPKTEEERERERRLKIELEKGREPRRPAPDGERDPGAEPR
jgi:hypothetical protein